MEYRMFYDLSDNVEFETYRGQRFFNSQFVEIGFIREISHWHFKELYEIYRGTSSESGMLAPQ
jgi:hypothetical protein